MNRSFCKKLASLALLSALALPAQAQTQDPATTYSNGKVLLQQERYDMAMAELMPLTQKGGTYAPEASYFYALAALKANKPDEAYQMLLQLQNQHPNWGGMADADYLLANVLFELGEYERALSKLQELQGTALANDAEGLKRYYLTRLNDRPKYEALMRRLGSDKTVAQVFADKLVGGWYRPEDKRILESLVQEFKLDRNRYLSKNALSSQGYDIALLLPFQLSQNFSTTARKSQFVTDMYAGMKLAQDSLLQQGIKINLFTYDTGTDTMSVKRVLKEPEMQSMDLIIGPVYKSTARVAARYAAQHNINVINPLSQDLEMAAGNANVFLFESSVATQARQAATYAYQNFSPKTVAILFENAKDDTTFAYHYRKQFQQLGGKVKVYKKFRPTEASATAATFREINLDGLGHMAVFSDKMTAAMNATSLLQGKAPELPLVTYESWLDINQITLQQLDYLQAYFISPKHVNQLNPANKRFREKYVSKYNLPPSQYAYAGFEMLFYFGQLLYQYGPQFNGQLTVTGIQPGVFYSGIGYTDLSQRKQLQPDNQYVPILKLENLELTVVNPLF
ncbi:ABC transporter substrate-binding protein [Pontibacter anaerobius]|uniref:ABC transporter substrate-binding protein n=1 Tax=Pontibacter anaerobius TaxID=2993940 RepID=A0ABT3RB51_9BACT|nr:ABC transporter substrate-binding protein [Pontibacter anaerobius]MCX2739097.1 ABC transporter substrate-binding protein [Pontibacter anaerobius]